MNEERDMTDSEEDIKKDIRNSIYRLLARREQSEAELLQKLSQKGFDRDTCRAVLSLFQDKDLQSDQRYAESVVRSAFAKGKGPVFIEQSLIKQNINAACVKDMIKSEELDWFSLAAQVREKRFGSDMPTNWQEKQKQMRFLQYRGFEQDHISELFN